MARLRWRRPDEQGVGEMCLGIPGRINEIDLGEAATSLRMATVDFGGIQRQV